MRDEKGNSLEQALSTIYKTETEAKADFSSSAMILNQAEKYGKKEYIWIILLPLI
ncbi:hypothetical protein ACAG39_05315 [Caldicellulosiruptoraceae bacterium PP1]